MFIIARPGLLGEREGAGVERVGELLVVLGDHPGAAAVGAVERHQLDPEPLGDQRHRAVQLGREAARDAAGPVGELHSFSFGPVGHLGLAELLLVGLGLDVLLARDVEVELGAVLLGVLVDALDVLLRVAGQLRGGRPGSASAASASCPLRMPRIAVGIEPSRPLIAAGFGISLPLTPGRVGLLQQQRLVERALLLDDLRRRPARGCGRCCGRRSPRRGRRARRRRMIWSIGATPFGQASTQEKQWVQS